MAGVHQALSKYLWKEKINSQVGKSSYNKQEPLHMVSSPSQNSTAKPSSKINFLAMACGILAPRPGIKPTTSVVEAWSLNHWTSKEVPRVGLHFFYHGHLSFSRNRHLLQTNQASSITLMEVFREQRKHRPVQEPSPHTQALISRAGLTIRGMKARDDELKGPWVSKATSLSPHTQHTHTPHLFGH